MVKMARFVVIGSVIILKMWSTMVDTLVQDNKSYTFAQYGANILTLKTDFNSNAVKFNLSTIGQPCKRKSCIFAKIR